MENQSTHIVFLLAVEENKGTTAFIGFLAFQLPYLQFIEEMDLP